MHRAIVRGSGFTRALGCAACILGGLALLDISVARAETEHDGAIELGAGLGVTTGGGSTPGGFTMGGNLLYRLSQIDWFEGGLHVGLGSGAAACFTDRSGDKLCSHGPVNGRSGQVAVGIRRYLLPREQFKPYVNAQVAIRFVNFPDDRVSGLSIPVLLGAGVRARVTEVVSVGGSATLELGVGWFNRNLGLEPQAALSVGVGVEFSLD